MKNRIADLEAFEAQNTPRLVYRARRPFWRIVDVHEELDGRLCISASCFENFLSRFEVFCGILF